MWTPSNYGGITDTWIKSDPLASPRTWTPDIVIVEGEGEQMISNVKLTDVRVSYTG